MPGFTSVDSFWLRIIYIISFLIIAAVAFLFLGPRPDGMEGTLDVSVLPKVNVVLNGITLILLVTGYIFIRQKEREKHKKAMLTAFGTSAGFLVSYVLYHLFMSGPRLYTGDFTTLYYFILITHILLAVVITPLALITLYRGWTDQKPKHRKIAKITLPIWIYVSITGVSVYWMLY